MIKTKNKIRACDHQECRCNKCGCDDPIETCKDCTCHAAARLIIEDPDGTVSFWPVDMGDLRLVRKRIVETIGESTTTVF